MIKSLKDTRRRMTESVLAKVGASERTTDKDYDISVQKFSDMIGDMNECGAALHSYLVHQKSMLADGEELAKSLARVYESNERMTDWPYCESQLLHGHLAEAYREKMDLVQNVLRSSTSTVCAERALDPLRAAVLQLNPEVLALQKERDMKLTDYDSFRRRLKEKEAKKEAIEAAAHNKGMPIPPTEMDRVAADLDKFQKKVQSGLEEYLYVNEKVKGDIIKARALHDQLVDQMLVTAVVCQAELFNQAACQLEAVIEGMPADKVAAARLYIHEFILQGGIKAQPVPQKGALAMGLDVVVGKKTLADYQKTSPSPMPVPTAAPVPSAAFHDLSVEETHRPSAPSAPSAPVAPSSAPPLAPPSGPPSGVPGASEDTGGSFVEALYDHEAEEEDELNFKAGDRVEVIEKPDGGWWRGRCNGEEGLFPSNYVQS
ncbi:hypothetical protein B484DRAFT_453752 [Ochromonadaceae sp. CCMP2298]|nr:hypothetical protein B484DRAFT_453752 [Ochromonadaceae sp. CCMP2298]|mmetsp:Transcript_3997/g.8999  ORF Transcript_3997/g.8999 Transcript_3997/m.8999 type:complete len:431 (-) Transcript_3997:298-1590(-)